jgi:hypothetical protein
VHGLFEFSSRMQTIEIYTPNRDARGRFIGLNHEAILYDPDALAQPIRIVRNLQKVSGFEVGDPQDFIECIPTIFPVKGVPTRGAPGKIIPYEVPNLYGRPWAHLMEEYYEKNMQRPRPEDDVLRSLE